MIIEFNEHKSSSVKSIAVKILTAHAGLCLENF